MSKVINLKNGQLTPEKTQDLYKFFEEQTELGIKYWPKDTDYTVNGMTYRFKNDIFQREGKNGALSYEVISNKAPVGKGTFGTVRLIKNTVKFSQNNVVFKKTSNKDGSRRVVKFQVHNDKNEIYRVEKEYLLTKKAAHLAIKKPTLIKDKNYSFTRMKYLKGKELQVILNEDSKGIRPLTLNERIKLSIALLKALKEQVTDKDIIHCDIKPANIVVDLGPPIKVNIIDYGLSINTNQSNNGSAGTPAYSAPEVITTNFGKISPKSDVYSLGRVLVRLWGGTNETYNANNNFTYFYEGESEILKDLFNNIEGLNNNDKNTIYDALEAMVQLVAARRVDINKAISDFKLIEEQLIPTKDNQSKEEVQITNNDYLFIIPSDNLTKTSLKEIYAQQFHSAHKKLFAKEGKLKLFRRPTAIKGNETLAEILNHATKKNNRTRLVCVKLKWLKKDGRLANNAPSEIVEAYHHLKNNANQQSTPAKKIN
ncbi:protein kinase domain-containing protein [Legionella sp. D16C41]|uniref:protein kinase domain-containing protein n=1 Tax=Legionella sp. D16C41 TaxID=3402688 RepID=UPI003AF707EF